MTTPTSLDKVSSRNLYRLARSHIGAAYADKAAAVIAKKFFEHAPLEHGCIIAGYVPMATELNPFPIMEQLCTQGYQCTVPMITDADAPLTFGVWRPETPLGHHPLYGFLQPSDSLRTAVPDIIITPLVACTSQGIRLGYGKGFYDRTLAALRREKNITVIGVCFGCQVAESLPSDAWDQRLDMVITEKTVHRCMDKAT